MLLDDVLDEHTCLQHAYHWMRKQKCWENSSKYSDDMLTRLGVCKNGLWATLKVRDVSLPEYAYVAFVERRQAMKSWIRRVTPYDFDVADVEPAHVLLCVRKHVKEEENGA